MFCGFSTIFLAKTNQWLKQKIVGGTIRSTVFFSEVGTNKVFDTRIFEWNYQHSIHV